MDISFMRWKAVKTSSEEEGKNLHVLWYFKWQEFVEKYVLHCNGIDPSLR